MYTRPKLKDICDIAEPLWGSKKLYLTLTESGGFSVSVNYEEGAILLKPGNLRKSVRRALDMLEDKLHGQRRERNELKKDCKPSN